MKTPFACLAFCLAALLSGACTTSPKPLLNEPQVTVAVMREAVEKDDARLFLHTLGRPVLKEYGEQRLQLGWSGMRPHLANFIGPASVVEFNEYQSPGRHADIPSGWVIWPEPGAKLMRVRLALDGEEEDFLFALEVDDPPAQSLQSRGFYVGDNWYAVTEHDSPQTYLVKDSPESERTHWRMVFPYYWFQKEGPLTHRLLDELPDSE